MGSTSKNKFAGAPRASVAPHARPRQGSRPGTRSPGPPRVGKGPGLQVERRLCLPSGAKRRRRQGEQPPAGDRASRSGRRGADGGGEGGATPASPASPKLSSGPQPAQRRRRREPPERSRGPPGVPASLPVRRARPSAASPLRPPAIRRDAPAALRSAPAALPAPPPAHSPAPGERSHGASCPRSLPPVKLSPASLRPTSPRPAPPSPPGAAAATAWAVPRRSRAPPRSHLVLPPPLGGAGGDGDSGGGSGQSQPAARSHRPARSSRAPPRRDAPRGEGGGGPGRARLCRAGSGRASRARPPCAPREDTERPGRRDWKARQLSWESQPGSRRSLGRRWQEPGGGAVEPGWQRRERLQAGRVPSLCHTIPAPLSAASVPGRITPLVRRDARCAK